MNVGTITVGQFIADTTAMLKAYTEKIITPELWYSIINAKAAMTHEMMSNKDRAIYKARVNLGNVTGYALSLAGAVTFASDGLSAQWTGSHGSIPNSTNLAGALLITAFEDTGFVVPIVSGTYLSAGDGTATLVFSTVGFSLETCNATIYIPAITESEINISNESWYKSIDQILTIYSSSVDNNCVNAETLENFYGIKKRQLSNTYKTSIVYVRDAEYLMFCKGTGVSSYGTRKLHYSRKPNMISAETDLMDVPDSHIDMMIKLCMLQGLQTLQVPIPVELQSANAQFNAFQMAKEKEYAELLQNKGDN